MKKLSAIFTLGTILALAACAPSTPDPVDTFPSEKINVYTRDTSSGTRDGFMRGIGFGEASTNDALLAPGFITADNNAILTAMTTDIAGIGYVSLASLNNNVRAFKFDGVEASEANVLNGTYKLKRPFVLMRRADGDFVNETESQLTLAFMAFVQSNEGADVIANAGGIPLSRSGSWASIVSQHPVCTLNNSAVTLKFGGSDSVQRIAVALSRAFAPACGNVVTENNHTGSSDGWKRTQGDEKDGVNYKHIGYASRNFRDAELAGAENTRMQFAWDAVVAIGHRNNPVESLTAAQLRSIFAGEFTVWGDLID